jgi:predicted RNA binding protein YcfA (HicA-like mRNA interferase family)
LTRLPIIDFRTMEKVLLSMGFKNTRSKGSHFFYRHPDGRTTTLPNHTGRPGVED